MRAQKNLINLKIILIIICVINQTFSAPRISTATKEKENFAKSPEEEGIDPCNIEELTEQLICANDGDCVLKNEERKAKRNAICALNAECPYCENDESEVEPEVVPTLNPPINHDEETLNFDNETELLELVKPPLTQIDINERIPANLIERNIVIENDNETHLYRGFIQPASNITTVIRLTNVVENNNIINIPTTLNNTNINNIHVYTNKSSSKGGKFDLGYTENGPCCWTLKAASCKTTTVGLKCRHKRAKTCGPQCQKKVINSNRAQCMQIPQYPYMICPPNQPYPWNSGQPPFDNNDSFENTDDDPLFPEDDELENEDSGWVVHQEKCKIVSEDGLQITNCTGAKIEFANPYARNSMDPETSSRQTRNAVNYKSDRRKKSNQPMMFPQTMYIPVFMMPQASMNYFMPQQLPPPMDSNLYYYEEPDYERKESKTLKKHNKKIIIAHDDEEL